MTACSVSWTDQEIRNAESIEITCYDNANGDITGVYTISDEKEVNNICNTFSLLVVKKTSISEPIAMSYVIRFLDDEDKEIENVYLLHGYNVVGNNGLFRITDEMDINRYIREDVLNKIQH